MKNRNTIIIKPSNYSAKETADKLLILAIFILIFADGCDVGQFSLSAFNTWSLGGLVDVFLHAVPGFIIMAAGMKIVFFPQHLAARIWISVISVIAIIGNIVLIILGIKNPDPNSVGVHSPGDWIVVIAIVTGALLWFTALLLERSKQSNLK